MRKTSLNTVYQLAKKNKKILFVGSDLGYKVLDDMKKELPKNVEPAFDGLEVKLK